MRLFCVAVLALVLTCPLPALSEEVLDLGQCLEAALENNPSLRANLRSVEEAKSHVKTMRADFLPSLSTNYSYNVLVSQNSKGSSDADYLDQSARSFGVTLTQILFSGFRILNQYQKAKLQEGVAQAELDLKRAELMYRVKTAFYRMKKSSQDVVTTRESIATLEENLKSAESFFKKELRPWVDVLQVRVDLANAKEQYSLSENNVRRQKADLFSLMGRPMDETVRFKTTEYQVPKAIPESGDCYDKAISFRPDIKQLHDQLAIAKTDADSAMGSYLPRVQLQGGYHDYTRNYVDPGVSYGIEYDRDQRNRYWSAGIYASWDLFDGGRSWYRKKEALDRINRIHELVKDAKHTISTAIQKALFSMADAKQRILSAREAMTAADEYVANQEKRLKAGVSTVTDLLNAQERRVRARGNLTQAILDFQLANAELTLYTGDLETVGKRL